VTDDRDLAWRNRRRLILIFLLFFTPALLAWLLILSGWRPGGTTNHGQLVQPPAPVSALPLRNESGTAAGEERFLGRWSMLLVLDGPCDDACLLTLDRMSRAHIALNKDADRVQLLLVLPESATAPALPPEGPALLRLPRPVAADLTDADPGGAATPSAVHLVDPYGYRMMRYPSPLDAEGLLKDLRRLLRLSKEDVERSMRVE